MEFGPDGEFIGATVTTKDGHEFTVRPARSDDKPGLERMFKACSGDTLYTRFLSPGLGVPLRYLDRLMTHSPPDIVALAAEDNNEKNKIAGLMNYVATDPGNRGEIAIVVMDECQNRGLGSAMLRCLYELSVQKGVKKFIADIDAGNRRVFHLIKRSGLPCRISIDQGVAHVEVEMQDRGAGSEERGTGWPRVP